MATKLPVRNARANTSRQKSANSEMGQLMNRKVAKTVQMKEQKSKTAKYK